MALTGGEASSHGILLTRDLCKCCTLHLGLLVLEEN